MLRASLRTGGEPVTRYWRAPSMRPRPVVLVCDVSGSMEPYARMLLQYLHACVAARRRVEAFAFGTRLTRITHELGGRDHDRALERAAAAVVDFSGGTRIGAALAELNRVHGRRLGRGAVVVILSDGWDRGDPRAARGGDGAAAAQRPPARVAEPARRAPRLRAADARDARGGSRTCTSCWPATRSPRWSNWPRYWRNCERRTARDHPMVGARRPGRDCDGRRRSALGAAPAGREDGGQRPAARSPAPCPAAASRARSS